MRYLAKMLLVALSLIMVSCKPTAPPTLTPTTILTPTSAPTPTFAPTATAIPTPTPAPTPTLTPTRISISLKPEEVVDKVLTAYAEKDLTKLMEYIDPVIRTEAETVLMEAFTSFEKLE